MTAFGLNRYRPALFLGAICFATLLAGCDRGLRQTEWGQALSQELTRTNQASQTPIQTPTVRQPSGTARPQPVILLGDDGTLDSRRVTGSTGRGAIQTGDGILLNFEDTALNEVVQTILGDTLQQNYYYDPRVSGRVTLQTVLPLPRDDVLPTLETLLRQNGAAMVQSDGLLSIVPQAEAAAGVRTPALVGGTAPLRPGFGLLVAPLKNASAAELAGVIEPLSGPQTTVRFDPARNVLILSGTSQELTSLRETIELFDVDWLRGLSYGLFPLTAARAQDVAEEIRIILGGTNAPIADQVTLQTVERLNAVLVVSKRRDIIRNVQQWVRRLDLSTGEAGINVYVYYVENTRAAEIATALNEVFSTSGSADRTQTFAPQAETVTISTPNADGQAAVGLSGATAIDAQADVKIYANEANNSLVIRAKPEDYQRLQQIIRQLDVVPLQVLIDVTIAEVSLNDQLSYGVQFFLQNAEFSVTSSGNSLGTITPTFPGLAASFVDVDATIVLSALDSVTSLNVISTPRIMVLDNQSAQLRVGDEVPIITQQQQNTDSTSNIVNNIEFRQTGVVLDVTPRVNSSGLVTLDVAQEISNVVNSTDTGTLTPTISQRSIRSSIAVQDGNTILLGGLIQERSTAGKTGIPILSDIPVLGSAFGQRSNAEDRTELIIMLTPRVVRNPTDVQSITNELRRRLQDMPPQFFPTNRIVNSQINQ